MGNGPAGDPCFLGDVPQCLFHVTVYLRVCNRLRGKVDHDAGKPVKRNLWRGFLHIRPTFIEVALQQCPALCRLRESVDDCDTPPGTFSGPASQRTTEKFRGQLCITRSGRRVFAASPRWRRRRRLGPSGSGERGSSRQNLLQVTQGAEWAMDTSR